MRIVRRAHDSISVCPICNNQFDSKHGNNPAPLKVDSPVCERCNLDYVIPARLKEIGIDIEKTKATDEILRSDYAVKYKIGDKVRFVHPGDTTSDEIAEIIGFDETGLYRIRWLEDGTESEGLGDVNLTPEEFAYDDDDAHEVHHAFDNKAQDSKPEKIKIVIKRIKK